MMSPRLTSTGIGSLLLMCMSFRIVNSQANYCNVNGKIHQVGESWTTATGNDNLKKCTCTSRGQWNCAYVKEDALMVVADVNGIKKVKLSGAIGFKTPFINNLSGRTVAVDVDIESDSVYWTDVSFERRGIYKATFSNGHSVRRFISEDVYEPNGIAFDWLAKNVYWTDAQLGAIFAARENGQHRTLVVGGLNEPRSIVVLPLRGLMFWSDQSDGSIEVASMDGSNRKVVIRGLDWPNEIAIDATRNKIYWIDGRKKTIESCNFDGTSWAKIHDFSFAFDNPAFGLKLFGDRLYFSVWKEKAIYSVTVLGQDLQKVVTDLHDYVGGLAIVNQKMQQAPISSSVGLCRKHRSPCSHLCLPKSRGSYSCGCPVKSGLVLSQDMHTCKIPNDFILYTSIYDGTIMMMSKEFGTKPSPVLLVQSNQPSAIDYDPVAHMVYWSDVSTNSLYRMFINGTGFELFLEDGIGIVDGLAVDWVNRHLYFTNYGWEAENKPFGRIEIISLDRTERKILVHEDLDKPRDIVIDQQKGFLYYSDWGNNAKVVRLDLDGRNPSLVPIDVENPNGLALLDGVLHVTDSHRKSALVQVNGTIVYGRTPSLFKYDTVLGKLEENMELGLEIPFGLDIDGKTLFVADWGKETIFVVDTNTGISKTLIEGVKKPTGIVRTSLNPKTTYVNACTRNKKCSHVCVPVDQDYSSCLCPDHIGKAMSEDEVRCVAADRFILVADVNKILMTSESPADTSVYMVVRTFDDYSNIVAVAYDPVTYYIYWADNGRQRISRKTMGSPLGGDGGESKDIEVIYTNIEQVDGMALDSENRLLYWTDSVLGTIEVLDLNGMIHSTVLEQLNNPRAIALDPNIGVMYWTEWGRGAMLMTAKMNGFDLRPLITTDLEWPNALFFDSDEDKLYMADGAKLKIQSLSATVGEKGDMLDYIDLNGTASHIFGLGKMGSNLLYTDWETGALYKRGLLESSLLLKDLTRPTQIYAQSSYFPTRRSQCSTAVHECSHICVPKSGGYSCLCPDHLALANNLKNCVRPENMYLYTTTLEPPIFEEENYTTAAWAEISTGYVEEEDFTLKLQILERSTVPENTTAFFTTNTVPVTTTTEALLTTAEQTTTTTIPPPPRFPQCEKLSANETLKVALNLPVDLPYVELTAEAIGLRALNILDEDLGVSLVNTEYSRLYPGKYVVVFTATDKYERTINCTASVVVKDITPPRVLNCPSDLHIESYDDEQTTFVTWTVPRFLDNSNLSPIVIESHKPGKYLDGLHNLTYTAIDNAGNKAFCSFMLAVEHINARCGNPWVPPYSYLTCQTDPQNGDQVCQITCEKEYRLTLKTPFIRCRQDLDKYAINWLPFLDDNVCKKPSIGNPQQVITLNYPCPCRPTSTFYDYTYQIVTERLRTAMDCTERNLGLGLCINRDRKLFLECINNTAVEVLIKVDLASLSEVPSYSEARRIVKRSVTEILDKAVGGQIMVRGSDMIDYPASENANLSDINILCQSGYKGVEDGCVECPRGTFLSDGDCEFCPIHTFQEKAKSKKCMNCPKGTGTRNVGSTHRSHCIIMEKIEESAPVSVMVIVASAVGGVVLIGILMAVVVAYRYRRKQKKQEKKEEARRRRQRARRQRSSISSVHQPHIPVDTGKSQFAEDGRARSLDGGESSDGFTSKRSTNSGKRVTIKEVAIEHRIPSREDLNKVAKKREEPSWRMALVMRNTAGNKAVKVPRPSKPASLASDDLQSEMSISEKEEFTEPDEEKSQVSATQSETETEKTLTEGQTTDNETYKNGSEPNRSTAATESESNRVQNRRRLMSSTSDLGDETVSMTSAGSSRATTPIKGVLKKPKRIMSMDDSVTFRSDSTLSNTLENARMSSDIRGRDRLRKSSRNGAPTNNESHKQQLNIRRSVSFDRGPSTFAQESRTKYERDPRFLTLGHRPMIGTPPHIGEMNQPPHFPTGPRPRFMQVPRMMNRPRGVVNYIHPNANTRMGFVQMPNGGRPPMMQGRMPVPPPYNFNWQTGYDNSDWDTASMSGSEMEMRKAQHRMPPPQAMMGPYPRPLRPRIRLQNGPMMMPPRYQPRFMVTGPTQSGY